MDVSTEQQRGLISETNKDIENPVNAKRFGEDVFYVLESEVQLETSIPTGMSCLIRSVKA